MTEKRTRGRRSKVDMLPEDIKQALNEMLRDGRLEQKEILEIINGDIEKAGLPDRDKLSQSGLNRYASRVEEVGAKIREMREVSEVWVSKLGSKPTSDIGKMLQEVVRTLAAETTLAMSESGEPVPPKALSQLALAMQRVEQAAIASHKREKEVRQAFAEEAANAVTDELRGENGMSEELENRIRGILLGKA